MKSKPTKRNKKSKSPRKGGTAQPETGTGVSRRTKNPDPEKEMAERLERLAWYAEHADEYRPKLLQNIKARLPQLEELLTHVEGHWAMEDGFYRFYHTSFKVYARLQPLTEQICKALQELLPDRPMNKKFTEIVAGGTGKQFDYLHNEDWLRHTRPIVEAFFHAHYFLKLACKYGRQLDRMPEILPSGWAAMLYLFNLR